MPKKTWIKLKRGLLAPKHRTAIGVRIWLYIHILDNADWETGKVFEWRDKDEAEDLCMSWRTLQQQRQQLEKDGYITCQQHDNHQEIIIHNWTNPREYSGEEYNLNGDTDIPVQGGTGKGTQNNVQGGTNQGTNQGLSKHSTLPYSSHITSHNSSLEEALMVWGNLFPNKPQPRPGTKSIIGKWNTRIKDKHFRDNYQHALKMASLNGELIEKSWFNFRWVIHNDINYQKLVDDEFAWMNKDKPTKSPKQELKDKGYDVHS